MNQQKTYIVELSQVLGEETTIYLETDGEAAKSVFAILEITDGGASIVDNCYRTISEAQSAWPEAIPPKPSHLTPAAIEQNCTIDGGMPAPKLASLGRVPSTHRKS